MAQGISRAGRGRKECTSPARIHPECTPLKTVGERDLTKVTEAFDPGEEETFSFIVFVPKSTSRLISVELTVRRQESQRSDAYSAQAYLPLA